MKMKMLILTLVLSGSVAFAGPGDVGSSTTRAACETQVKSAAQDYVALKLNDSNAGATQVNSLTEIMGGQGDVRNALSQVAVIYHQKGITSVHDLAIANIDVLFHAATCRIVIVSENKDEAIQTQSEKSRHIIRAGKVIPLVCADSNLGLQNTKTKEKTCLGFNNSSVTENDLVIGNTYILGGELTEDGFFPNEFLD
jgi:hypothetical protein